VHAVLIVGSRARLDHPADEWADLDVALVTTQVRRYQADSAWLAELGEPAVVYRDPVGTTWHVLFVDGVDAGIAPIPVSAFRLAEGMMHILGRAPKLRTVMPARLRRVVERAERDALAYVGRGARVLVDKHGLVTRALALLPSGVAPAVPASADEFGATMREFWFKAIWTAKHLRRGELWHAKTSGVDGRMKTLLLRMLAWHAQSQSPGIDTWEDGRFLEEWADEQTRGELSRTFARYDDEDLWRALVATMVVFRRLARATAAAYGYEYDVDADARVTQLVIELAP
jgi:aminoglycoside 6-adenylyltransferase